MGDVIPNQDLHWNYQQEGEEALTQEPHTLPHGGMEKYIVRLINYDKVREAMRGKDENPALFQGCLVEAFRKYTNINPDTPKGKF